jgi:hypothetical protein
VGGALRCGDSALSVYCPCKTYRGTECPSHIVMLSDWIELVEPVQPPPWRRPRRPKPVMWGWVRFAQESEQTDSVLIICRLLRLRGVAFCLQQGDEFLRR